MTIGDEVETFLKTVAAERILEVENWSLFQDRSAITVTFCTNEGKAVAVFNRKGLKNFIESLQVSYEGLDTIP